jgi:hypothetical protein
MFAAIGLDNVAGGFAGTCLIAYMSSLTSAGFTATQYALFSSLYAIPGRLIASQSGRIVEHAARLADGGGLAVLTGLFAHRPPQSFATALEKSGVSPEALGAGSVLFFLYSALIGVFAGARRDGAEANAAPAPAPDRLCQNLRMASADHTMTRREFVAGSVATLAAAYAAAQSPHPA